MLKRLIIVCLFTFIATPSSHAQIVALGASSTAGYGVGASAAYPAQLQEILRARGRPMSVGNAGISGDTTGGMRARLSRAVPEGTKIVILQIAGNDAMKGMRLANAQANRDKTRKRLHSRAFGPLKQTATFCRHFAAGLGSPTVF